jgi:hypothetical protein
MPARGIRLIIIFENKEGYQVPEREREMCKPVFYLRQQLCNHLSQGWAACVLKQLVPFIEKVSGEHGLQCENWRHEPNTALTASECPPQQDYCRFSKSIVIR